MVGENVGTGVSAAVGLNVVGVCDTVATMLGIALEGSTVGEQSPLDSLRDAIIVLASSSLARCRSACSFSIHGLSFSEQIPASWIYILECFR